MSINFTDHKPEPATIAFEGLKNGECFCFECDTEKVYMRVDHRSMDCVYYRAIDLTDGSILAGGHISYNTRVIPVTLESDVIHQRNHKET